MKEVVLLCGAVAIFVLCWLLLKKLSFLKNNNSQLPSDDKKPPTLAIGFEHTEEISVLSGLLERFSQQYPSCQLNLFYGSSGEIRRQLNAGKIDLGFLRTGSDSQSDPSFGSYCFLLEEHVITCQTAGLPVIPLSHKKFLEKAIWKKEICSPEAFLLVDLLQKELQEKEA